MSYPCCRRRKICPVGACLATLCVRNARVVGTGTGAFVGFGYPRRNLDASTGNAGRWGEKECIPSTVVPTAHVRTVCLDVAHRVPLARGKLRHVSFDCVCACSLDAGAYSPSKEWAVAP